MKRNQSTAQVHRAGFLGRVLVIPNWLQWRPQWRRGIAGGVLGDANAFALFEDGMKNEPHSKLDFVIGVQQAEPPRAVLVNGRVAPV
jgi:hypothetical protein